LSIYQKDILEELSNRINTIKNNDTRENIKLIKSYSEKRTKSKELR
jgi:hypothetical protein